MATSAGAVSAAVRSGRPSALLGLRRGIVETIIGAGVIGVISAAAGAPLP